MSCNTEGVHCRLLYQDEIQMSSKCGCELLGFKIWGTNFERHLLEKKRAQLGVILDEIVLKKLQKNLH